MQRIKYGPVQQPVKTTFQNVEDKARSEIKVFYQDLTKALVATHISLKNIKLLLQKIPDCSTISSNSKNIALIQEIISLVATIAVNIFQKFQKSSKRNSFFPKLPFKIMCNLSVFIYCFVSFVFYLLSQ